MRAALLLNAKWLLDVLANRKTGEILRVRVADANEMKITAHMRLSLQPSAVCMCCVHEQKYSYIYVKIVYRLYAREPRTRVHTSFGR